MDPERRRRRLVELRVFALQQSMYPPKALVITPEHFKACLRCFLPGHYLEVVEERGVGKLCGYPLCTNASRDADKWFRQDKKAFVKKHLFCSTDCHRASDYVERQISNEAVMHRKPLPHLYHVRLWGEEGSVVTATTDPAPSAASSTVGEGASVCVSVEGEGEEGEGEEKEEGALGDVGYDSDEPPEAEEVLVGELVEE